MNQVELPAAQAAFVAVCGTRRLPTKVTILHGGCMLRRRFYPLFCLLGLVSLAVLTGCGSSMKLGGVTASVLSIRAVSPGKPDAKVLMTLRFTNENVVPIGFSRARHKLYLNDRLIADFRNEQPVGIPPLSTANQEIVLPLEKADGMATLREIAKHSQASYRIESTLYVEAGEDTMEIRAKHQGSVDLVGFQPSS